MEHEIAEFIESLKLKNASEHTIKGYATDLKEFKDGFPDKPVTAIGKKELTNFLAGLRRYGFDNSTANRKLSALRSFFKFLVEKGTIAKNPAANVKAPRKESKLPSFLTEESAEKLMDTENLSPRDRAILETLYGTGVRASELIGMNIGSLDFVNETVTVLGKGSKERKIPLTRTAIYVLKSYLANRNMMERDAPLFLNKYNQRLSQRGLQNIVNKHIRMVAELRRMSPHTLRHTYASVMLNKGCDLRTIQELLGHASIASTQIYTHLTTEKLKQAYKDGHPRA
ncbi:MAG: tyrosine-type recombinase/integrase [bacterium]|nr:tyrosine-type recombinase/integrase [bacterium]